MDFFDEVPTGYTFDDACLVPAYSDMDLRSEADVSSSLFKDGHRYCLPVISANMNSVTEGEMINTICKYGGTGAYHRYLHPRSLLDNLNNEIKMFCKGLYGISLGVRRDYIDEFIDLTKRQGYFEIFHSIKPGYIVIDIAHGDHKLAVEAIKIIKNNLEGIKIIAGNICTPSAALRLVNAGADCVKVGIGPGSQCKTRTVCGTGYPQLSAIKNIYKAIKDSNTTIIADGGIRRTGDIIKALAAGADFVMLGGMLAGTKECPGQVLSLNEDDSKKVKLYQGMASKNAQICHMGGEAEEIAAEGVVSFVPYKGSVDKILKNIHKSLQHGFSYFGCRTIKELHEYGDNTDSWVKQTQSGYLEGLPHGLR